MEPMPADLDDRKTEIAIGNLLRYGVLSAGTLVLVGGFIYLARHGMETPNYHVFRGEPPAYKTLFGIWDQAVTGHGRGLIQLGLLLLVATPIARVALCLVAFARQRDHLYVVITLIVLGVLLYGLLGKVG